MPVLTLPDSFPFPNLVQDVATADSMYDSDTHYLSVGLSALRVIDKVQAGRPTPRSILDMPSGYGRVTRVFRARYPEAAITVCDIDREAVAFAAERFQASRAYSTNDFRSLDLGRTFDLIWVGSLITHFSAPQTREFLDCMARHMTLRSALFVSSHGTLAAARIRSWKYGLSPDSIEGLMQDYRRCGYGYRDYPGGTGFGISVADQRWFMAALADSPLRVQAYQEAAWDGHHDVLVLRRRRPPLVVRRVGHWVRNQLASHHLSNPPGMTLPNRGTITHSDETHPPFSGSPELPHTDLPTRPLGDFDEAWYRAKYPDVATAIARGEFLSGLQHYIEHGRAEGRLVGVRASDDQ